MTVSIFSNVKSTALLKYFLSGICCQHHQTEKKLERHLQSKMFQSLRILMSCFVWHEND